MTSTHRWLVWVIPAVGLAIALAFPWLQVRPNRIVEGTSRFLLNDDPAWLAVLAVVWLAPLAVPARRWLVARESVQRASAIFAPVVLTLAAGWVAGPLSPSGSFARVSPSAGYWLTVLWGLSAAVLTRRSKSAGSAPVLVALVVVAVALAAGWLSGLSLLKEYEAQPQVFWSDVGQHLLLAGIASAFGTVFGVTLGWAAWKSARFRPFVFATLNAVQTLPSLALFGLLIVPLAALGWGGIGTFPALIALSLYAMFPITRSTLTALQGLDPAVLDAGKGLGFGRWQSFAQLQVPLALPAILDGVRTASVQAVGNVVVAALIGAGGLGSLIFFGLGQFAPDLILLGTLPVVALAWGLDGLWSLFLSLLRRRRDA